MVNTAGGRSFKYGLTYNILSGYTLNRTFGRTELGIIALSVGIYVQIVITQTLTIAHDTLLSHPILCSSLIVSQAPPVRLIVRAVFTIKFRLCTYNAGRTI